MRKACCDCAHLGSYGGSRDKGTVECSRHPKQYVRDPFEHVQSYVCDNFGPKFLSNPDPTLLSGLQHAQRIGSEQLQNALNVWFAGPPNDVTVATSRGMPMLSVADGGLETFEHDTIVKSHKESNHVFADVFGGARISWPIVQFLSFSNRPGVSVDSKEGAVSIIYLGQPYSLAEITAAFSYVLAQQGIQLVRPWFRRFLRRAGIDPNDPSFTSFRAISGDVERLLVARREMLLRTHSVVVFDGDVPDLEAVAEFLGLKEGVFAVVWADARDRLHLQRAGTTEYEFASPYDIRERLVELGVRIVLAQPTSLVLFDVWARLAKDAFSGVEKLLVFVDRAHESSVVRLPCFSNYEVLVLDGGSAPA